MRLQQSNDIIILLRSDALEEDLQLLEKSIWYVMDKLIFGRIYGNELDIGGIFTNRRRISG
jgi:hypothetical protein